MSDDLQPENKDLRPSGKRQVVGVSASATTSSEVYAARRAKDNKAELEESGRGAVKDFFPEVVDEMKRVIWPTGRQMVNYTAIVLAFLIVLTAIVAGVDFLAGLGVEKVLIRD